MSPQKDVLKIRFVNKLTEESLLDIHQFSECWTPFCQVLELINLSFNDSLPVKWKIIGCEISSIGIDVVPLNIHTNDVVTNRLERSLHWYYDVQVNNKRPDQSNDAGLMLMKEFSDDLFKQGVYATISLNGDSLTITEVLSQNARKLLNKGKYQSEGSIKGILYGVNLKDNQKRWRILIQPNLGSPIPCSFKARDPEMIIKIKECLHEYVDVYGILKYAGDSVQPAGLTIKTIEKINVDKLPTWREMFGFTPNLTRGIPSSQYIREQRGDR